MKCPECGTENKKDSEYCNECGNYLKNIKKDKKYKNAINLGYICAIFFMPLAWIISAYLLTRDDAETKKQGNYILAISIFLFIILMAYGPYII